MPPRSNYAAGFDMPACKETEEGQGLCEPACGYLWYPLFGLG